MKIWLITAVFLLFGLSYPAEAQNESEFGSTIEYLSKECADGNERVGVYIPKTRIFHDITLDSTEENATPDRDAFMKLCSEEYLQVFHCHTKSNSPLYLFPSSSFGSSSSDFGFAINSEFYCASKSSSSSTPLPEIEHFFVHTGGENKIVKYGLSKDAREHVHSLGIKHGMLAEKFAADLFSSGTPSMMDYKASYQNINADVEHLIRTVDSKYTDDFLSHFEAICGFVNEVEPTICQKFSIESFANSIESAAPYYILPYNFGMTRLRESDERVPLVSTLSSELVLGSTDVTELSPQNYDSFRDVGNAIIISCGSEVFSTYETCEQMIEEARATKQYCRSIQIGVVDAVKYPELTKRDRFDDEFGVSAIRMFKNGERMRIVNTSRYDAQLHGNIMCDFNINWPAFSSLK